jgi:hypothetical protein
MMPDEIVEKLILETNHSIRRIAGRTLNEGEICRFGFKFYSLAESDSGYVARLLPCQSKNTRVLPEKDFIDLQRPGAYVMTVMKDILNRGHIVGLDNFYTDIVLFMHLRDNQTDAIGTIRCKRRALPVKIVGKEWKKDQKGYIYILTVR